MKQSVLTNYFNRPILSKTSEIEEVLISKLPEEEGESSTIDDGETQSHSQGDKTTQPVVEIAEILNEDPAVWPSDITQTFRSLVVKKGPIRVINYEFPFDSNRRRFNESYYSGLSLNGESFNRRLLVYSTSKNTVYCFCCTLFGCRKTNLTIGMNDWRNISKVLKEHEVSKLHKEYLLSWLELEKRLHTDNCIDNLNQTVLRSEAQRWRNVFQRLITIVKFLASHNLAFREKKDTLGKNHNGNFLGLVKAIAEFDPVMEEHIRRSLNNKISDHYLSKDTQNELIHLMAEATKEKILMKCKKAKYYSVISDCTRDISRVEQMTLTIRFVDISESEVEIQEHFLGFSEAKQSTGEYISDLILRQLENNGLDIQDCRGQGYDNGSNMKGRKVGVQKRLLDVNPRAYFVPCGCHSLNLVLKDACDASLTAVNMFAFIQKIYTFFSASSQRWEILRKHVTIFTAKPLSTTRWQSRIDSVKSFRYQMPNYYDALQDIFLNFDDNDVKYEANCLGNQLKNYSLIVAISVWYDILFQINLISKKMQSVTIELDTAIKEIEKVMSYLKNCRNKGLADAQITAREISEEMDVDPKFASNGEMRTRKRKRQFDYECEDEPINDQETKFRVEFFNVIVDQAISSLEERFEQLNSHNQIFGFLYDIHNLSSDSRENIMKYCKDLQLALTHGDACDINCVELCDELIALSPHVKEKSSAIDVLRYICCNNYKEAYLNVVIALRILLTLPVTVASGERNFSRLKLIKTYLSSTMCQERLTDLAQISIEWEICSKIDFENIIKAFSEAKARKIIL